MSTIAEASDRLAMQVNRYLLLYRASVLAYRAFRQAEGSAVCREVLREFEAAADAAERAHAVLGNEAEILDSNPQSLEDAIALLRLVVAYAWDHDHPNDQPPNVRVLQTVLRYFRHEVTDY